MLKAPHLKPHGRKLRDRYDTVHRARAVSPRQVLRCRSRARARSPALPVSARRMSDEFLCRVPSLFRVTGWLFWFFLSLAIDSNGEVRIPISLFFQMHACFHMRSPCVLAIRMASGSKGLPRRILASEAAIVYVTFQATRRSAKLRVPT